MGSEPRDITQDHLDRARVAALIRKLQPDDPLALFRPQVLHRTAQYFLRGFPGHVSYAVKANPAPEVLHSLVQAGVTAFDVASLAEAQAVRAVLPDARLHYHNPVRSRSEIAKAKSLGVASWSVDRLSELDKLGQVPNGAQVAVRVSLGRGGGAYDFGSKFGASPDLAETLLRAVAERGMTPALTFHPGTQCTDPASWADYIAACADIAARAGVTPVALNVGGGFPSCAQDGDAHHRLFETIAAATRTRFAEQRPQLWCEPGRGMVAGAMWLLLRVKARGVDMLTLNDGLYGALGEWRDMAVPGDLTAFTENGQPMTGAKRAFTIFGPTCDSLDRVPHPWRLPSGIAEEDYILVTGAGAYSLALVTQFNGYGTSRVISLETASDRAGQCRLAG
ncbi:alanine racemase [Marivita sp. XM-24bin2]|uniref:alanine racemase n=1 Tax=unclassified Marivita TaxID=2632480 RepID=UPI000D7B3E9E|nr:alanine racemase [Marivita sp. XM-24bin2]MCR9111035.1 alanine racemase [Paracoccaceae bacterium]PWL35201.1 MAG: ornithine decarboxylase [Marivita sp. XM-24bin2]